jgi:hypothetical protein
VVSDLAVSSDRYRFRDVVPLDVSVVDAEFGTGLEATAADDEAEAEAEADEGVLSVFDMG